MYSCMWEGMISNCEGSYWGALKVVLGVTGGKCRAACRGNYLNLQAYKSLRRFINPNQAEGGGQICPTDFQMLIPLEPNVGFTPNQAVNSSLSVV